MSRYVTIIDGMTQCAAADLMSWAESIISGEGVINVGGALAVSESDTPALSVEVQDGQAFVLRDAYVDNDNTQKFWHVVVTAAEDVSIDANSSGSTRIDRICVKIDTAAVPDATASNVATLVAVKGTPGGSAPTVPSNHLGLAQVSVEDGETTILDADITDERDFAVLKTPGSFDFPEIATPEDPAANFARVYSKDDGGTTKLYFRDSAGTETEIGGAGGDWTDSTSWSYGSYNSTYKVATITVPTDATTYLQPGMRVKFSQTSDGQKYGIIVAINSATSIDVFMGTDYDFDNEAITSPAYSSAKAPFGMDMDPNKWKIETTDATQKSATTGTTWGNTVGLTIAIPKGAWDVEYMLSSHVDMNGSALIARAAWTLSTTTNSESDADFTSSANYWISAGAGSGDQQSIDHMQKRKILKLTSNTTYNLLSKTDAGTFGGFWAKGDYAKTIIRAICAYL